MSWKSLYTSGDRPSMSKTDRSAKASSWMVMRLTFLSLGMVASVYWFSSSRAARSS